MAGDAGAPYQSCLGLGGFGAGDVPDRVDAVAGGAGRRQSPPLPERLPVRPLRVLRDDLGMALAAGLVDVEGVRGGFRFAGTHDQVPVVAVGADRGIPVVQ